MSELITLTQRMANVEAENKAQSTKLDDALTLLKRVDLALTGDAERGITGIVATAKSAHRRLDEAAEKRAVWESEAKKRMDDIEADAIKERWVGRIGSGVVGATVASVAAWLKTRWN